MTHIPNISAAAAALGRKGGQSTSEAKQAAARANGKRGGRPKKITGGSEMTKSGFKTIKVGDIVIYRGNRLPQYAGCEARVTAIDYELNQATLALPDKHVALVTADQIEK